MESIGSIYTYKHTHTIHLHTAVFKRMTKKKQKKTNRLLKQTLNKNEENNSTRESKVHPWPHKKKIEQDGVDE